MAKCVGIEPFTLVMDLEGTDGRERGEVRLVLVWKVLEVYENLHCMQHTSSIYLCDSYYCCQWFIVIFRMTLHSRNKVPSLLLLLLILCS